MKKGSFLFVLFYISGIAHSQNILRAVIKDSITKETLPGASVLNKFRNAGTVSGANRLLQLSNMQKLQRNPPKRALDSKKK